MENDFKQTIKAFFASVYEYNEKMKDLYNAPIDKKHIDNVKEEIKSVEKMIFQLIELRETKPYDARILSELAYKIVTSHYSSTNAFIKPNSYNNDALIAYRGVIEGITEYYSLPVKQEEKILRPIKNWKYITADGFLKKAQNKLTPLSGFIMKDYTK